MADGLLDESAVARIFGYVGRGTVATMLYRDRLDGTPGRRMPLPDTYVARSPVWRPETIQRWLEEKRP